MSNSSLISCFPLSGLEKYWEFLGKDGQLFYDYRLNLFTFRKDNEFWAVNMKDNVPVPDVRYQVDIKERIVTLSYSRNKKFVAIHAEAGPIRIVNIETKEEQLLNLKASSKGAAVLLVDWLWKLSSNVDLIVFYNTSLYLFKMEEKKTQLKQVATHTFEFQYVWFEPKSEVLILANRSGLVQTIFLDGNPKSKKIKGPSFLLDLRTKGKGSDLTKKSTANSANTQQFFVHPSLRNRDLLLKEQENPNFQEHLHKILFVHMYGVPSLIHLNVDLGQIFIFFITSERVNMFQSHLSVSPRNLYSLSLVDNLIVVNNLTEKKSFTFDTKRQDPAKTIEHAQSILIMEDAQLHPKQDEDNFLNHDVKRLDLRRSKSAPQEDEAGEDKLQRRKDSGEKYKEMQEQAIIMEANLEDYDKPEKKENGVKGRIRSKGSIRERKLSRVEHNLNASPEPHKEKQDSPLIMINPYYDITEDKKEAETQMENSVLSFPTITLESCVDDKQLLLYSYQTRTLDYSYIMDSQNKTLLKYEINPRLASNSTMDNIDTLFFLIRRNGCKEFALDFIKRLIMNKTELTTLSFIFNKLIEIYQKAQEERDLLRGGLMVPDQSGTQQLNYIDYLQEEMTLSMNVSASTRPQPHNLKTSSSYTVILQSDLYMKVFLALEEDSSFDQDYLVTVILEYLRVLIENEMSLLDSIQTLCLKVILIKKQYSLLHLLIQFYCLNDDIGLAETLIKLGMKDKSKFKESVENPLLVLVEEDYHPELFQLGVDMLHRQKKTNSIVQYLIAIGKIVDAMEFSKKRNFEGIDPKCFLEHACEKQDKTLFDTLSNYFLNNIKRNKEDKNIFDPSLEGIIKTMRKEYNFENKKLFIP